MNTHAQIGYDDTPLLPRQPWKVHDRTRPWPAIAGPWDPVRFRNIWYRALEQQEAAA